MSRRILAAATTLLCVSALAATALAGELPKLEVNLPPDATRASKDSSFGFGGSVKPGYPTGVSAQVFHVLADGGLIRQVAFSLSTRDNGTFSTSTEAPAGGWMPGRSRMVISVGGLPQVKREYEFHVEGPPVLLDVAPTYPPEQSKLVVRLPLDKVQVFDLPPDSLYLVEGSFRTTRRWEGVTGPLMFVETLLTRDDGQRVMASSLGGPSFVQPDGSCWYQLQLTTPREPGLYHVRLAAGAPGDVAPDAFGTNELPFSIQVVEAAEAKK